jgi:BirA family transcriptional regulator, biotin operon repressor / biotin---[acetyl-CoA-carboxylase] ligase
VSARLGTPRLHLRSTDSTNQRARALAGEGAPDGMLVTASEQKAGRGRQGRTWSAPPGQSLLMSVVVRPPPRLLPLMAAVAVADVASAFVQTERVTIKWPNDVLLDGRKVAGILVEGRPQEGWAVAGIGVNVAVDVEELPEELRETAASLGLGSEEVEAVLARILDALGQRLEEDEPATIAAWRERDALLDRRISWAEGEGVARGVDDAGRLVVESEDGSRTALDAGEVHLGRS